MCQILGHDGGGARRVKCGVTGLNFVIENRNVVEKDPGNTVLWLLSAQSGSFLFAFQSSKHNLK